MSECTKCGGPTEGFKCDVCGALSETHKEDHKCGGENCMAKCKGCDEAQVKCSCSQIKLIRKKGLGKKAFLDCR